MVNTVFEPVQSAIDEIAAGGPVVVAENVGSRWEGDLIIAAATATPEQVAFMVRHTGGFICTTITDDDAMRLGLPPMVYALEEGRCTAFSVTVDARDGVGTGISARDRARTMRLLANPATHPDELTRPGHMVPVRVHRDGALHRARRPEAASDLAQLAGLGPAAALCTLVSQRAPTAMADLPELRAFCDLRALPLVSVDDVVTHRSREIQSVMPTAS